MSCQLAARVDGKLIIGDILCMIQSRSTVTDVAQ